MISPMRSEVCGGVRRRVSSSVHLLRSLSIGMLECGNATVWLARILGPWDWVMRLVAFFFSWYGAQCRESDSLASDRLLYPFRCKIPPEDLSLRLLDSEYVGPTAGGRSLRDETWSAVGRQGEHCTPCGQRSDQLMIASAIIHRTTVAPPLNHEYTLKGRLLAAVKTSSRGRNKDYFASDR